MKWIFWKDLTKKEREQARNSYICIVAESEGIAEEDVDSNGVEQCTFERMEDGYIYVNL